MHQHLAEGACTFRKRCCESASRAAGTCMPDSCNDFLPALHHLHGVVCQHHAGVEALQMIVAILESKRAPD
jgi:hypothetical protein